MPEPIAPEIIKEDLSNQIDKFYANYRGAEDSRTPEEKEKDINQVEFVASAAPVDWKEKKKSEFRSFPELNQFFTYKCVAFTIAKLALINFWLKTKEILFFSPNSIYDYRSDKSRGGMIGDEAFKIWQTRGISLEAVARSNQIQENDPFELSLFSKEVAKGFRLGKYITIDNGEFDRVASTIQETGKGVMCWFFFTDREWSKEVPKLMDDLSGPDDSRSLRHSTTAVDFGIASDIVIINGEQVIKIEDSAHFGGKSVRYITRQFFQARTFLIKYPMNFNYEDPPPPEPIPEKPKPKYTFNNDLVFGMNNFEVAKLQDILKYEGLFPTNVASTGYYGNETANGVERFQIKYGISPTARKSWGPLSRAKSNSIYG